MQAIVLTGGFGTRLRSRISDRPKPMAPVAGRPFLEYLLDHLDSAGCTHAVLATGHMSEVIEGHFGRGYRSMRLTYSREAEPLGTGGAILKALREMPREPAIVLNGDTWQDLPLSKFVLWCRERDPCDAIVLRKLHDAARYGRVDLSGDRVCHFGEKSLAGPGLVNAGVYWLRLASLQRFQFPTTFSIETDYFERHMGVLDLRGYVTDGQFIDIGIPEDYDRAQVDLPQWLVR